VGNRLAFWDVPLRTRLNCFRSETSGGSAEVGATSLLFSRDGRVLVVCYRGGVVRFWDFKRSRLMKQFIGHSRVGHGIVSLRLSRDGHWLASNSLWTVVLYDVR